MSAFRYRIGTRATVNCRAGIHSDPLTFLRRQKAQALGALRRLDGEFPSMVTLGQKSVTRMSVGCGNWRSLNERRGTFYLRGKSPSVPRIRAVAR